MRSALEPTASSRIIDITSGATSGLNQVEAGALVDPATFRDRLNRALASHRTDATSLAVIVLSLDPLMHIVDGLGGQQADLVREAVRTRLPSLIYPNDFMTQLGIDEFAITCQRITSSDEAATVARRVVDVLSAPLVSSTDPLFPAIHVGAAVANGTHRFAQDLVSDARAALTWARENGGERFRLFDHSLRASLLKRSRNEGRLRRALDRGEFSLFYQPLIDLEDHSAVGVEALLRWKDPTEGFVGAGPIIAQAERTDLISQIGSWVLREAAQTALAPDIPGMSGLRIHLNLSPRELAMANIVTRIESTLSSLGVAPSLIGVEITERMPLEGKSFRVLKDLKALGLEIALDDFGTGHSSIQNLAELPVDALKIDRSLVEHIVSDQQAMEVLIAIVLLGHAVGLKVLAEGIENADQLEAVRSAGCDVAQGFYIAVPQPAHLVGAQLDQWSKRK